MSSERFCFAEVVQFPHILRPVGYQFVIGMLRRKPGTSVQCLDFRLFRTHFFWLIISACYKTSMPAFQLLSFTWRIRVLSFILRITDHPLSGWSVILNILS